MVDADLNCIVSALSSKLHLERAYADQAKIYDYYAGEFDQAREKLRKFLRLMHGYGKDEKRSIGAAKPDSPLMKLREGKRVWISDSPEENTIIVLEDNQECPKEKGVLIDGATVKKQQEAIDIMYDATKITAEEVYHIQQIKAGDRIEVPSKYKIFKDYKLHLEQVGSYVVIRGKVWQSHEYNGKVREKPIERTLYYAAFPKLQGKESKDLHYFCEEKQDGYYLRDDKKGELKEKMKAIIRLQAKMAAKYNEALDIVTPNAFFYALEQNQQEKAKKLFAEAIIEFAQEEPIKGFKGLFVHPSGDMEEMLVNAKKGKPQQIPVLINKGNAASPGRLAIELELGFGVAECVMSEVCGHAGNGALGDRGNSAKEENDARVMSLMQVIFGPQFNSFLMQKVCKLASVEYKERPIVYKPSKEKHLTTTHLVIFGGVALFVAGIAINFCGVRDVCSKFIDSLSKGESSGLGR